MLSNYYQLIEKNLIGANIWELTGVYGERENKWKMENTGNNWGNLEFLVRWRVFQNLKSINNIRKMKKQLSKLREILVNILKWKTLQGVKDNTIR